MLSTSTGVAVLTLSAGLLLATVAEAKTIKCTVTNRGTAVSIAGSFCFDGSTTSIMAPEHLCRKHRVRTTSTLLVVIFTVKA